MNADRATSTYTGKRRSIAVRSCEHLGVGLSMSDRSIIYIVDNDAGTGASLLSLLDNTGYELRIYASGAELLSVASSLEPGCIVCDARMPDMDGLTLCRSLREQRCHMPVVLVTSRADVTLAVAAMKAGANDFLEQPLNTTALLEAIQATTSRRFGRRASDRWADEARRRLGILTEREQEVLAYLVAGESNKSAAAKLKVSPRTVEFHRAHILDKTGSRGMPDLVRLWLASIGGGDGATRGAASGLVRSDGTQVSVAPSEPKQRDGFDSPSDIASGTKPMNAKLESSASQSCAAPLAPQDDITECQRDGESARVRPEPQRRH